MKKLEQISSEPSLYQRTKLLVGRSGNGIPHEITVQEELGRGSNNRVFKGLHKDGTNVVIRCPRRKSDTERAGYATWEFRHTLIASKLGIAPHLYDAWYVRHAKPKQKAGLHLISEYLPIDGQHAYHSYIDEILTKKSQIEEKIYENLRIMAENDMFCYDLKPGNIVMDLDTLKVKFIDFGREFCEQNPWNVDSSDRAPITTYIKKMVLENVENEEDGCKMYRHLLFLTMLILLSSNTSYYLFTIKEKINADKKMREDLNFVSFTAKSVLGDTRGKLIKMVRKILRQEDIKSCCRHYMTKRNAGTRRILQWADGTKV
mgnify:CR=1 FL=1